ncbi:MAG: efflux RND transporter periplasmic adaptor subunit, partial [candidate division KSB1 bacterium]|nr:efflux RND transporter periplasmic adaptor subunit [candidate division KSB1 bacterium]
SKQRLEYVKAKSQLVRARATVALAEERLKDTILKAPISGIILQKNVQAGQIIASGISNVAGGTLIVTVADLNKVYITANVDETDIGKVEKGQPVRVVADAFPEETYFGRVLRIDPLAKVEQNVTTFEVTTEVDNPQFRLKAGMNATVEIILAEKKGILLLPNEALQDPRALRSYFEQHRPRPDSLRQQRPPQWWAQMGANPEAMRQAFRQRFANRKAVLVKRNGKVVPQMVETGISNFEQTEIVSGLQEGEVVMLPSSLAATQPTANSGDRSRDLGRSMRFLVR